MARQASARLGTTMAFFVSVLLFTIWYFAQCEPFGTVDKSARRSWTFVNVEPSSVVSVNQQSRNFPTSLIDDETNTTALKPHSGNWTFDFDRDLLKLQKRAPESGFDIAAGKALFSEYDRKGSWLWCALKNLAAAGQSEQSIWTRFDEIKGWGWKDSNDDDDRDVADYEKDGVTELVKGSTGYEYDWSHTEKPDLTKLPGGAMQEGSTYPVRWSCIEPRYFVD